MLDTTPPPLAAHVLYDELVARLQHLVPKGSIGPSPFQDTARTGSNSTSWIIRVDSEGRSYVHVHGERRGWLRANWCFFVFYAIFGARELLRRNKNSRAPNLVSKRSGHLRFCGMLSKIFGHVNSPATHPVLTCTCVTPTPHTLAQQSPIPLRHELMLTCATYTRSQRSSFAIVTVGITLLAARLAKPGMPCGDHCRPSSLPRHKARPRMSGGLCKQHAAFTLLITPPAKIP